MLSKSALSGLFLVAAVAVMASAPGAAFADDPQIIWRVDNPFRFFTDSADTAVHRATFEALSTDERLTPVLSAERALERRHDEGWAARTFLKTCWQARTNRFRCPDGQSYVNPERHLVVAIAQNIEDAAALTCTWATAPINPSKDRGDLITQPCDEEVRLKVPYPGGLSVKLGVGGREVAAADIKVTDALIVGMGDSFASGEGNPDVPVRFSPERAADYGSSGASGELAGYPARVGPWAKIGDKPFIANGAQWLDQACHRSLYSYQLRAALQLAIEDPHRAITYVGVACSGSEVTFGLFLRYKGNEWVPNPPILSQIAAVAEAQCGDLEAPMRDLPEAYHINGRIPELKGGLVLRKCGADEARKIDLLFLSIGGNDIGFSRLLANAVLSDQSTLKMLGGWLGEVFGQLEATQRIESLDARYKAIDRAAHYILHIPHEESDRIILSAYPGIALMDDVSAVCPDGRAGLDLLPDFELSHVKAREGTWVADKLHIAMREHAASHGWTFSEAHRRSFLGRGACAGSVSAGGPIADDLRMPRLTADGWKPFNPTQYRAYVPRLRWVRTPNDAFMTANFHVPSSLAQKVLKLDTVAWFQLLLAATYSGAFHPTAEGQAAIADALVEHGRIVLGKYDKRPAPALSYSPVAEH